MLGKLEKGIYKHYKGKLYEVLGLALHTKTREKLVIYKALYEISKLEEEFGKNLFFVRPYNMFFDNIIIDGKNIPRFKYIGNETYKTC